MNAQEENFLLSSFKKQSIKHLFINYQQKYIQETQKEILIIYEHAFFINYYKIKTNDFMDLAKPKYTKTILNRTIKSIKENLSKEETEQISTENIKPNVNNKKKIKKEEEFEYVINLFSLSSK